MEPNYSSHINIGKGNVDAKEQHMANTTSLHKGVSSHEDKLLQ